MWYIILGYIVIFKLPVAANAFQFRSVADMTNIYRTKVMHQIIRGRLPPAQGQFLSNYQPTTCITLSGRYEGGLLKNQKSVCNTVQKHPEPKRPAMPTTQLLRYSQISTSIPPRQPIYAPQGMIKPQIMLPKQLQHIPLTNHNPQNIAKRPVQVMMRPLIRASLRPTQGVKRVPTYHAIERNEDYQIYPQVTNRENGNKDHQEYPSLPQTTNVLVDTGYHQEYAMLPQATNPEKDHQEYASLPNTANPNNGNRYQQDFQYDGIRNQQEDQQFSTAANSHLAQRDSVNILKSRDLTSTSTALPGGIPTNPIRPVTETGSTTTSTIPPFPGGFIPEYNDDGDRAQVCAGKARCNQFIWTTRKSVGRKASTKPEEFILWTP